MTLDEAAGRLVRPFSVRLEAPDVTWSIVVRSLATGEMHAREPARDLSTASVGNLLLLAEVARRLDDGRMPADELLHRTDADAVADSGLWQHLDVESLTARDAAVLVAATSDNLATNVLLRRLGVKAMDETARALGLSNLRLHDYVRDERRATDPPRLSSGSAQDLAEMFVRIGEGSIFSPAVSGMLAHWLGLNTDLSMVASSLDLDPLAHAVGGAQLSLMSKTGTDTGVRADCGLVSRDGVQVAYAAIANWDATTESTLALVMADMRSIGGFVRGLVEGENPSGA